MEELAKVNFREFYSSVGIHQNHFINKFSRNKEEKLCEVSQDTDKLFVHTINFL